MVKEWFASTLGSGLGGSGSNSLLVPSDTDKVLFSTIRGWKLSAAQGAHMDCIEERRD